MNALSIGTSAIRQFDGLYSLNDLHKASGGNQNHKPAFFLRNEQTQALISEINRVANSQLALNVKRGGDNQGTYACRELVIAYAAWISPAFHLQVIRVFLDSVDNRAARFAENNPLTTAPHTQRIDPWHSAVRDWLASAECTSTHVFYMSDILQGALDYKPSHEPQMWQMIRVGNIMHKLGFIKKRETRGIYRRWYYERREAAQARLQNGSWPTADDIPRTWKHEPASHSQLLSRAELTNLRNLLGIIAPLFEHSKLLLSLGRTLGAKPLVDIWSMIDHMQGMSHGSISALERVMASDQLAANDWAH